MVSIAHENNIKIVIDFAPNHTSTAEYSGYSFPEDGALFRNGNLIGHSQMMLMVYLIMSLGRTIALMKMGFIIVYMDWQI